MQRSLRGNVLAVLLALPVSFGLVWIGCATADEEVDAAPKRAPRDSAVQLDEDGNPIVEGDGMIFPTDDGGMPLCPGKTETPNTCSAATDLGSLTVGAMKDVSGGIALTAGDLWYKVTFTELTKLTAHPSIKLTSADPNIIMEVTKSCAGELVSCQDEVGVARNIKDYEVTYMWDAGGPEEPDPTGEAGVFKPIEVGDGGAVWIHVFRLIGEKKGCDFKLQIAN